MFSLRRRRFTVALCAILGFAAAPPSGAGQTLVVGTIGDDIEEEAADFRPLAGYLAARLADRGVSAVRVAVGRDAAAVARGLRSGAIDLYIDSPLVAALVARWSGAEPMLRRWKKGAAEYHSVFVARKGAGIGGFDDLLGRVVAFDQPHSSSGYLLPKAMLLQRGYRLVEVKRPDDPVPADAIGYVFTGDDRDTLFWILRGRVVAGVTSPSFLQEFDRKRDAFEVFARSTDIPRHVVVRRGDLDPGLAAAIEEVLLGMEHDAEGRKALRAFQRTVRFDRFPGGVAATFGPIHAMLDLLGDDEPGL